MNLIKRAPTSAGAHAFPAFAVNKLYSVGVGFGN